MPLYGLDIALPADTDPDPTLPWADDDDALLVPGSVLLLEPAHSALPVVGTPTNGSVVPNIAWKRARDIVGSAVFTGRIDNGVAGNAGKVLTVSAIAAGKIVPGQLLTGTGVTAGTLVLAQISGTAGGVGVYSVTNVGGDNGSYNVAATTITANAVDAASIGARFQTGGSGAAMAQERTPKGGLHLAISQTADTVNGTFAALDASAGLRAYMLGNQGHTFYTSMWELVTRPANVIQNMPPQLIMNTVIGGGTSNYFQIYLHTLGSSYPTSGAGNLAGSYDSQAANPNVAGLRHRALATTSVSGTLSGLEMKPFTVGHPGAWSDATTYGNKSASRVMYRVYIEDLTVSGRSYADVLAQDQALYAAAFGAGGRYAGDTFTAPLA